MRALLRRLVSLVALVAAVLVSPATVAFVSFVLATGMVIAGVYVLFGLGWSLLAGAAPLFTLTVVLTRGLSRE